MTQNSYEMSGTGNRLSRGSSLFGTDPQIQLRNALKNNDFATFRKVLISGSVDPEYFYDYPDYKTCLDIAASDPSKLEFLQLLLQHGVNENKINETHSAAAIHFAAQNGNKKAVKLILECDQVDVNIKSKGNTALLLAVKKIEDLEDDRDTLIGIYEEIIEMLLKAGCDANAPDSKGITPIYSAAKQGLENVIKLMIDYSAKPVDIDTYKDRRQKNARTLLNDAFPHLVEKIDKQQTVNEVVESNKLFYHLSKLDEANFIHDFNKLVKTNDHRNVLAEHNGSGTFLQIAADKGLDKVVSCLLNSGADANAICPANKIRPVSIACSNGHYKILKIFADNENTLFDAFAGESLLEATARGMKSQSESPNVSYSKCFEILLKHPRININVNHTDDKANTALHYAARNGDQETVLALLRNGACIGIRNSFDEPALADINPKTLEIFLNECLTTNEERPSDEDYEIYMKYSFLVYPNDSLENEVNKPLIDPLNNNNANKKYDSILAPETDALLYMTTNDDLKPLLKHPVIKSFLYLKWQRISCMFYANITFYALFWLCLILHILLDYGVEKQQSDNIQRLNMVTYIGSVIGLLILMSRELFQLIVSPKRYLISIENWVEIVLIIIAATILFKQSASERTKQQLSAVAILLSSTELVMLIGQFPALSTNITMLRTVSWNFFKFLLWYCILIIAFALSFYTLFRKVSEDDGQIPPDPNKTEDDDDDLFLDPGTSLFKTIVMLTGEFDAGSIKFNTFPVTSHIIFIVFVFMIPIVLFNLLNGLAVSDTQAIKADAELVGHVSRVKLISHLESVLLSNIKAHGQVSQGSLMGVFKAYCAAAKSFVVKPLAYRICLFPYFLPQQRIIVKPNQNNRIEIPQIGTTRKIGDDDEDIESGACLLRQCTEFQMHRSIVKSAKDVISERNSVSEYSQLEAKLGEYGSKIDGLETLIRNLATTIESQNRY